MTPRFKVIVLSRAFAELDEILEYIAGQSRQNAASMIETLWQAIESLEEFPHRYEIHEHRRDRAKTVRSMPVKKFIVYYRVDDDRHVVRVLSVRHGSRKQPRRLK
jgi:plasmid stabilization system protein ParE